MTKPKPKHLHKPTGRPKRSDAEVEVLCEKVLRWALREDSYSFDAFAALEMNVTRSALNEWVKAYPAFSEAFRKAKAILANRWLTGSLTNKLNGFTVNNFYYQLSDEHKEWIRELKDKSKDDSKTINVVLPDYFKEKKS